MDGPILVIDRDGGLPIGVQLVDGLRRGILDGALRAGDRMPPTRGLASELGVSRSAVVGAYEQLAGEGYLEMRQGAPTRVADLTRRGFGDVDVHYHHDNDTAEGLRAALLGFTKTLRERHGLLREPDESGLVPYTFVHGNWALDNSRPDGRWCGVDNELSVLVETGCKADFTLPSAPSDTQTSKINSIYFARGCAGKRKQHDTGRDLEVGQWGAPDELLLVQGPLGLNWRRRKLGLVPKIENAEISADAPPTAERVPLWFDLAPRIRGAERHVFIKLHTHGAEDPTLEALLKESPVLPVAQALEIVEQVASALEEAHAHGIVHRDIKPANVFLDERGRVKVGDFGIARMEGSDLTEAGVTLGTPGYAAPEIVRGGVADARSDVFALGALAYRLLTGEKPFRGNTREGIALDVVQSTPPPPASPQFAALTIASTSCAAMSP